MAKYDVKRSCGHMEEVQLFGPNKDRESKIEWMESTPCRECWQKERSQKQQESNIIAAKENQSLNLPTLEGSEKQVAWAEKIRNDILKPLIEQDNKIKALPQDADIGPAKKVWNQFYTDTIGEKRASWWIDNRNISMESMISDAKAGDAQKVQGLVMSVFSGHGNPTSWQDIWGQWLNKKHPDIVIEMQKHQEAKDAESKDKQDKIAARINDQMGEDAEKLKEEDMSFDRYGNWESAAIDDRTWSIGTYTNSIGKFNGEKIESWLDSRKDIPNRSKLEEAIAKITEDRRDRIASEQKLEYESKIREGHVVSVDRTKARENNTTVILDNGLKLTFTVGRKEDDWGDMFAENKKSLKDDYKRLGLEAKDIFMGIKQVEPQAPAAIKVELKESIKEDKAIDKSMDEVEKLQGQRSARSIAADNARTAKNIVSEEGIGKWIKHPERYDIQGVDTKHTYQKVHIVTGTGKAKKGRKTKGRSKSSHTSPTKLTKM